MSRFYQMFSIHNRSDLDRFSAFYEKNGVTVTSVSLAYGTAVTETLNYLGLEATEKVIIQGVVTDDVWQNKIKAGLHDEMDIDLPGVGIAFTVPLASVGGRAQLSFLCGNQNMNIEQEESALKDTKYELLVAIGKIGQSDIIMEAARRAGARGGTVVHAKGTGAAGSEKFFGVSLASEREMIYIVVKSEERAAVMQSIMDNAGPETPAQAIVFSLPVSSTVGIKFGKPSEVYKED